MYRYDSFDREFVRNRVAQFRQQVERRIDGSLTEEEFKPLRLMNGLYLQLHAYMLRVAIPYGTLDSRQMRQLAHIAERWDKGYGHFTTRQNVQFNWPKLKDVPDILDALADVEMHAIQTSGNCVRNVTADHFRRRGRGRNQRSPPDRRAAPAVVDGSPGIRVPAEEVQDRGKRLPGRPRRDPRARYRHPHDPRCGR